MSRLILSTFSFRTNQENRNGSGSATAFELQYGNNRERALLTIFAGRTIIPSVKKSYTQSNRVGPCHFEGL
jgi:hypothetical protein